jgi:hypothetical protein
MASRNRGPLHWGIMRIEDVRPMHVARYIEQLEALRKAPTVIVPGTCGSRAPGLS